MSTELNSLYQDILRDHQRDPRNFGGVDSCQCKVERFNPVCGDRVKIGMSFVQDRLQGVSFEGEGCSISQASASILTEELEGRSREDALIFIERFRKSLTSETPPSAWDSDVDALMGVRAFPVRMKCALISWTAAKECLEKELVETREI